MQNLIELFRTAPLPFIVYVIGPLFLGLVGGILGSYSGFDNLKTQMATEKDRGEMKHFQENVVTKLDQIKTSVETVRPYEALLPEDQKKTDALSLVIHQYDQLRHAIATQSRFTGQENIRDRIVSSDQTIENLRAILGVTQTVPGPGGQALLIRTAPNTFRVIFAVPMRIPPRLEFGGLPQGVAANVVEKTNVGFTVIFTPQSIGVDKFGFIADAEIIP